MIKNKQGYLTSKEAAQILGFSADHVRRLLSRGKIEGEKFGQVWMVNPKALAHVKRQRFPRTKEAEHGSS